MRRRKTTGRTGAAARGMTLLEIMVVLVLIAVLLAVTFPRMRGTFDRGKVESAARNLTSLLRYARQVAVLRGDGAEVRFDPKLGQYQLALVDLAPDGTPLDRESEGELTYEDEENYAFKVSQETRSLRSLPGGVHFNLVHSAAPTFKDEFPRVIFFPDGSATPATIGLQNEDRDAYYINIYRTTGMAMLKKGQPTLPPDARPLYYLDQYEFEEMYRSRDNF